MSRQLLQEENIMREKKTEFRDRDLHLLVPRLEECIPFQLKEITIKVLDLSDTQSVNLMFSMTMIKEGEEDNIQKSDITLEVVTTPRTPIDPEAEKFLQIHIDLEAEELLRIHTDLEAEELLQIHTDLEAEELLQIPIDLEAEHTPLTLTDQGVGQTLLVDSEELDLDQKHDPKKAVLSPEPNLGKPLSTISSSFTKQGTALATSSKNYDRSTLVASLLSTCPWLTCLKTKLYSTSSGTPCC